MFYIVESTRLTGDQKVVGSSPAFYFLIKNNSKNIIITIKIGKDRFS